MNKRPQSSLSTMLSMSAVRNGVSRGATFKVVGKEQQDIDVPLPDLSEIPEKMNIHLVEIPKDHQQSLGISLVPASGKCDGYFLVGC